MAGNLLLSVALGRCGQGAGRQQIRSLVVRSEMRVLERHGKENANMEEKLDEKRKISQLS
ncbi:MAG: hypothetical protein LUG47_10595 [Clostridiales bacterium]|nr:hypothetical protein [Clostridiales bacterium]